MIRQDPTGRPRSVDEVKQLIQRYAFEAVSRQRLSQISQTIIPAGEVDDPLAYEPPKITGVEWGHGTLKMSLDRPVHERWVSALQNMGNYESIYGLGPEHFNFMGKQVTVNVDENSAQRAIDFFKQWLPKATQVLKQRLEQELRKQEREERERLERARIYEETQLRINRKLTF